MLNAQQIEHINDLIGEIDVIRNNRYKPHAEWQIAYLMYSIGEICRSALHGETFILENPDEKNNANIHFPHLPCHKMSKIRNYIPYSLLSLTNEKRQHFFFHAVNNQNLSNYAVFKNLDFMVELANAESTTKILSHQKLYEKLLNAYRELISRYVKVKLDEDLSENLNNELSMRIVMIGKIAKLLKEKLEATRFYSFIPLSSIDILNHLNGLRISSSHKFITNQLPHVRGEYIRNLKKRIQEPLVVLEKLNEQISAAQIELQKSEAIKQKMLTIKPTHFVPRAVSMKVKETGAQLPRRSPRKSPAGKKSTVKLASLYDGLISPRRSPRLSTKLSPSSQQKAPSQPITDIAEEKMTRTKVNQELFKSTTKENTAPVPEETLLSYTPD